VPLERLTTPAIRGWLQERLATGAARSTVCGELAAFSGLLTDAMLDGLIAGNPAHGAMRRLGSARHIDPKALTKDQLEVLTQAADLDRATWLGSWVRIGARSGLRPGEQLALGRESLRPPGMIWVTRTYHGTGIMGPPKGGRARVVEVSAQTMRLLLDRVSLHPFLFPGRHRDRPLDPASLDRASRRAIRRAGLPGHLTPHCLRHTYASMLVSMGAPLAYVRQQLGHASIRLTVDLYGSGLPASRPDLLALLDREPAKHPPRPARHHGTVLAFTRPHPRRA
jgi:integrase